MQVYTTIQKTGYMEIKKYNNTKIQVEIKKSEANKFFSSLTKYTVYQD